VDIDNDGDIDLIAGNLGLNTRLQASVEKPVRLYYNDFDDNGKKEQVLTYYAGEKEVTLASKDELQKQIPNLRKKFLYAADFANASIKEIFTPEKISGSIVSSANYFANAVLINNGNLNFIIKPLPWQAQLSTYRDAAFADANHDNLVDIFLTGNYYSNSVHTGRYDADNGTILINQGAGNFKSENLNGFILNGEARHILPININNQPSFIIARNNDSALILQFKKYF
jgi:enediyne biosynthesis protein E4